MTQEILNQLYLDVEDLMAYDDPFEAYTFITYLAKKYGLEDPGVIR